MADQKWITRTEIIEKTGISGPELDEYIAEGIIPEPVFRRENQQISQRDKKNMFPASAVWRVKLVKRLKQEGESMESIAGQFGDISYMKEDPPILLKNEIPQKSSPIQKGDSSKDEGETNHRMVSFKKQIVKTIFGDKNASSVSLCVVSVDMQNLDKISDALMPEDYFDFLNKIYKVFEFCASDYRGIKKDMGKGKLCFYFFKQPKTDYIADAVSFSIKLQEKMAFLNLEMKTNRQTNTDVLLNIGIAEGNEFAGIIQNDTDITFLVLGITPEHAGRLGEFGQNGEIWATKSGIGKMALEDVKKISFGVCKSINGQLHYIPNVFSKIKDILIDESKYSVWGDFAEVPVTCIKGSA